MNRNHSALAILTLGWGLLSCGGEPQVSASPFAGTGAFDAPGVIAAVYLGGSDPFEVVEKIGLEREDVDCVVYLLDEEMYGAEVALDLGGGDPESLLEALGDEGWVERIDGDTYRFGGVLERLAGDRSGDRLQRLTGSGFGVGSFELRRYDADGRILLIPTIDLRQELRGLGARIRRDVSGAHLAVALDGAAAAAFLRRRILPALEGMSVIASAAMRDRPGEFESALFAMNVLVDVVGEIEGWTTVTGPDGSELRITPRPGTPTRDAFRAFRPIDGSWPRVESGTGHLLVSLDGTELCDGLSRLFEESLLDRSLEFVERVEEGLVAARRLGLGGVFASEGGLALRIDGAPDAGALVSLERLLGASLDADRGWLIRADGAPLELDPPSVASGAALFLDFGPILPAVTLTLRWEETAIVGVVATQ